MDNFTSESWFKARYHFTIDASVTDDALKSMQAVIERPDQWSVKLNGKEMTPASDKWWLDRYFPVYEIGALIKKGENIIELSAPKMTVFSELMPVYILGDFNLENAAKGFLIKPATNPGLHSWKEKGLPFYGDKVSYSKTFTVVEPSGEFQVQLGPWKGAVAEVWVNGKNAGNIGWAPYQLDVSRFIQKGENLVEVRISGSLKNTLGYHHVVQSGWIDSPFSWNQGPVKQPSGSEYQFLDYGLFKEFSLMKR
jgi:hypothetical protein